jgi:toxin ParE1/3/4
MQNMAFNLVVKPIVYTDLDDAIVWYENKVKGLGKRFLFQVEKAKQQIQSNPHHYSIFHKNIRRVLVDKFPYKIYYLISEETVLILGISHAKRSKAFINRRLKVTE